MASTLSLSALLAPLQRRGTSHVQPMNRPWSVRGAAASALAWWLVLVPAAIVQASVRALPAPQAEPIERALLNPASPYVPGPDSPALEKRLQILRTIAQREVLPPRRQQLPRLRKPTDDPNPPDAAWLLGLLALHGLAMPADPAQAQHWFERAQLLGHPLAPAGMAWCQISGCVASPNPATAMHWIALLRRAEPGLAKYLEWHAAKVLAPLAEPTAPGPALREPSAAARRTPRPSPPTGLTTLLAEAGRAGNSQAQNELGLEYLASGNLEQALVQFQAAAARSETASANANLLASRMDSSTKARSRMPRNSTGDGYQDARRYHLGDGVPANYTEAIRLYQIAAARGDPRSRRMLELIFSRPTPGGAIDITWMQQLANIGMATEVRQGAITPVGPSGWQRDPSPLYALVPDEWHIPYRATVR